MVLIKWPETIQNRKDVATVSIPALGDSPLCPIHVLKTMIQKSPASDNDPMFLIPRAKGLVPLTDFVARKHLKDVCITLGLQKPVTFHYFRRVEPHGPSRMEFLWNRL